MRQRRRGALAGPFCHRCGQEAEPAGRAGSLRRVLGDAVNVDGRTLRSLGLLVARPGFLTREYAGGPGGCATLIALAAQVYLVAAVRTGTATAGPARSCAASG